MGDMVNRHGAMVFAILFSTRPILGIMRVDSHKLKAGFAWRKAIHGHMSGLIILQCSQCTCQCTYMLPSASGPECQTLICELPLMIGF